MDHKEGRARFSVADNGSGIAPEYRQQVFELFTRLVPSSIPGTGMGLALARKMVHLVGGKIAVEEGIDGGAAIVFDLPTGSNTQQ
ncbi:MAG: ATP-binding protein [Gammaproteobacteria bacterium]|nr:ATP-binding protein [Gammaproteobacteria bacterium]